MPAAIPARANSAKASGVSAVESQVDANVNFSRARSLQGESPFSSKNYFGRARESKLSESEGANAVAPFRTIGSNVNFLCENPLAMRTSFY